MKYRADIDGLRALAVMLVLVFHYFPHNLGGGFVGVDVFFVISGYLITKIITGQMSKGTFSFIDFYKRRVRRLFPSLVVVLSIFIVLGWGTLFSIEFGLGLS